MIDFGPHLLTDPLFLAAEHRAQGFNWDSVADKIGLPTFELRSRVFSDHKRYRDYLRYAENELVRGTGCESINILRQLIRSKGVKTALTSALGFNRS